MLYISDQQKHTIAYIHAGFKNPMFGRCYDFIDVYYKNGHKRRFKFTRFFDGKGSYIADAAYDDAIAQLTKAVYL